MKRKVLITTAVLATLTLTACQRHSQRGDNINERPDVSYVPNDGEGNVDNGNKGVSKDDSKNGSTTDPHYDYVNQLGFTNIANTMGHSYYRRYKLDSRNAADNDVFHGWRHTWVEPNDYINEEIDVYRYTGNYNGQNRTIHILSHRGKPIGGYHFGDGETAEHARMVDHDGQYSRVADDFRETWNDMFEIRH